MADAVCNISGGALAVNGASATCAGSPLNWSAGISVVGLTTIYSISVSNAQVALTLNSIRAFSLSADRSALSVFLSGGTVIAANSPGIVCAGSSNVTFADRGHGALSISVDASAAIGSAPGSVCDRLCFTNGTYAISSNSAAAIGAGRNSTLRDLLFAAGAYSVATKARGACIGSGVADRSDSTVVNLTILNGSFALDNSAGGGLGGGAGIGASTAANGGLSRVVSVKIRNGTFSSAAASRAPVLGAGGPNGGNSTVDALLIENGAFSAVGALESAMIGVGGVQGGGCASVENLTILNGSFEFSGGQDGAVIGTGSTYDGRSSARIGLLDVRGGCFDLSGQTPGIGAGNSYGHGESGIQRLIIANGTVRAVTTGATAAVGTGDARGEDARSFITSIEILGGDFDLTAKGSGAALGSGSVPGNSESAGVGILVINGGRFNVSATSGAGVGTVDSLDISDANITVRSGGVGIGNTDALVFRGVSVVDCRPGVSKCITADSIDVNGSVGGLTSTLTFFPSDESITVSTGADIFVRYRAVSDRESLSVPALHFGRILGLSNLGYELTFANAFSNKTVSYASSEAIGVMVSLEFPGNYSVEFTASNANGRLCNGSRAFFLVDDGDAFVSEAVVCGWVPQTATKQLPSSGPLASTAPLLSTGSFTPSGTFETLTSCPTVSSDHPDEESTIGLIIGLSSAGAVLITALIVGAVLCHRRKKPPGDRVDSLGLALMEAAHTAQ
jgi:hypothetical protein